MSLKSYAISVAVVVVLTEISDLLLPSGRMKSATKMVFSLITVLVFASPVITFFKNDFDFSQIFETGSVEINQEFVDYSNDVREELFEDIAVNALKKDGFDDFSVKVECENIGGVVNIKKVELNFENSVIIDESWHIHKTKATETLVNALGIDKKVVTVDG